MMQEPDFDLFIIGGGVNGCAIARDAAGRGLRVGLAEMGDLASATSSASTKLFHGGLRYLEYLELGLVRASLRERETLLRAMPHISRPMRFVLPLNPDMRFDAETPVSRILRLAMPWTAGRRPAWMIRLGLALYDRMGGGSLLAGTRSLDLRRDPAGAPLARKFTRAFEYSDCWVDDARLVALNARDAADRGAAVLTRTRVTAARREGALWRLKLLDRPANRLRSVTARGVVNAAGPWAGRLAQDLLGGAAGGGLRLVRGSHIVTPRLFDHERAYFLQGRDGRIIFAIPYEGDFTLIGTTDCDHPDPDTAPCCTDEERSYLCRFASEYFARPVTPEMVVWSFAGLRALHDDDTAQRASAASRDYTLRLDTSEGGAPLLHVFGGKITTHRRLAEAALSKLAPHLPPTAGGAWTRGAALPGGDFAVDAGPRLIARLLAEHPFLAPAQAARLIRSYGTDAWGVLNGATRLDALGQDFGHGLHAAEVDWLVKREFARTAEDILWRRSKLGLRLNADQVRALESYLRPADAKGAARATPPTPCQETAE
ncbi:glycerol-3-phosphate dehydrogenase [Brevirhabdus sp.]|uniref:glycerol-3-phosphate dehydrogenase n=1 Tax=Brevirhabdus sp. TaxID=2004514 RepID=UPI004058D1FD